MTNDNPEEQVTLPRVVPEGHPLANIIDSDLPPYKDEEEKVSILEKKDDLKSKPLSLENFEANASKTNQIDNTPSEASSANAAVTEKVSPQEPAK